VAVDVEAGVTVEVGVTVAVGMTVLVCVALAVGVATVDGVGIEVGVAVGIEVGVAIGVGEGEAVFAAILVGAAVVVGVALLDVVDGVRTPSGMSVRGAAVSASTVGDAVEAAVAFDNGSFGVAVAAGSTSTPGSTDCPPGAAVAGALPIGTRCVSLMRGRWARSRAACSMMRGSSGVSPRSTERISLL